MRKLFVFVVMSTLAIASGCGVDTRPQTTADDPTLQHEFTRDTAGRAVPANASVLEDFNPRQSFDHTIPSKEPSVTAEGFSCAGVCDAEICVCIGDLDCCIIGCVLCWEILE